MIYYETETWRGQIFRFSGTVWPRIWRKWLAITLYMMAAYWWCARSKSDLGKTNRNVLGSTLSFLLVFRANTAYKRYWEGRTILTHFFCVLREVVAVAVTGMPGGEGNRQLRWRRRCSGTSEEPAAPVPEMDHGDQLVCEERVNIIRWCITLAVAMQLHTRILEEGLTHTCMSRETKWQIDFDRYRIRHLTTEEEFNAVDAYIRQLVEPESLWDTPAMSASLSGARGLWDDGEPTDGPEAYTINTVPAMRLPLAVLCKLNQVVVSCINDPRLLNRTWGLPERLATVLIKCSSQLMRGYTQMTQVICTPLPFPYFHLCKTLLLIYFLVWPLFVEHELGFWANVVEPSFLTLALLGVDAIAIELENPFGIDENDLDFFEKTYVFEQEVMLFLDMCGDERCKECFMWVDMPPLLVEKCVSPIRGFLALRTQVESDGASTHAVVGGRTHRHPHGIDDEAVSLQSFASDDS